MWAACEVGGRTCLLWKGGSGECNAEKDNHYKGQ
jgi:hypothetical protein